MTNILLTGGSGFLGSALMRKRIFKSARVIGRKKIDCNNFIQISLEDCYDFESILEDIEVVVHVAARAHVMNETSSEYLDLYRNINTHATLRLAEQAAARGIKRFIFISSIKVLGEFNLDNKPFTYLDPLNPQDSYSRSKAEAEVGLKRLSNKYNMEIVIIRPPLVYGENVRGNFKKLLALCSKQFPLPLASIRNKRSLVSVNNLADLIAICTSHPKVANEILLISDDYDVATPELLSLIAKAGGFKSNLFRVPLPLLRFIFVCVGKVSAYDRLSRSMQVDITHTKKLLGWQPPQTMIDGLVECFFPNE
jgi:UDP-glucose 4-epimerase